VGTTGPDSKKAKGSRVAFRMIASRRASTSGRAHFDLSPTITHARRLSIHAGQAVNGTGLEEVWVFARNP
jgi:hypothetical protein